MNVEKSKRMMPFLKDITKNKREKTKEIVGISWNGELVLRRLLEYMCNYSDLKIAHKGCPNMRVKVLRAQMPCIAVHFFSYLYWCYKIIATETYGARQAMGAVHAQNKKSIT